MKLFKVLFALSIVFAAQAFLTIACIVCTNTAFELLTSSDPIPFPSWVLSVVAMGLISLWIVGFCVCLQIVADAGREIYDAIGDWIASNNTKEVTDSCPAYMDTVSFADTEQQLKDYRLAMAYGASPAVAARSVIDSTVYEVDDAIRAVHEEHVHASRDWTVVRGKDIGARAAFRSLQPGGDIYKAVRQALNILPDGSMSMKDIAAVAGCTVGQARVPVAEMISCNILSKVGKNKSARYVLVDDLPY